MLEHLIPGLLAALSWGPALALVIGVAIGMVIGAIPGLSGTMAVALAIPFTYGQDPITAFALLAGIHNGASQGSAIPAILLRIPGSTGSIATCFDGYPMTQQGHSAAAIRLSAVSSAVGGMASAVALLVLAPPLAIMALNFGPPEIFWLNVFGLTAIVVLVGNDVLKGLASVAIGLLISTVGVDVVTGQERFTFSILELSGGISELALIVGMFSLPPTLELARNLSFGNIGALKLVGAAAKGVWRVAEVWRVWIRASIIGIILGIIPGSSGGTVFIAYTEAKRVSKKPERFGKGSPEGLAAAEAVNNADNAAAMIPTLTLGIPGSAIAALMMGALLVHGMQPGPALFRDNPLLIYGYSWQMFLSSLLLIPLGGIAASRIFVQVLRMPPVLLMPIIVATMVVGVFASENSIFNVYVMLAFGALGLLMVRLASTFFGRGAGGLAAITSSIGAGAIVGGMWLAHRGGDDLGRVVVTASLVLVLALLAFLAAPGLGIALPFAAAFGAAMVIRQAGIQTMLQLGAEAQFRGRVLGLYQLILHGGGALGGLAVGMVAELIGIRGALAGAAAIAIAIWLWLVLTRYTIILAVDRRDE